jgi:hypothetical protein
MSEENKEEIEPKQFDPVEIEKQLLQQAEDEAKKRAEDPTLVASAIYAMYTPKFIEAIDKLSLRKLRRLVKALVQYPINNKEYKMITPLEKEMFAAGNAILESKFLLILHSYSTSPEIAEAAFEENLTDAPESDIIET